MSNEVILPCDRGVDIDYDKSKEELLENESTSSKLTVTVKCSELYEVKDIVISCAVFAYTDNVSVDDFKSNMRYLLEKIGINTETYNLEGGSVDA